jgi:hypothetical protein
MPALVITGSQAFPLSSKHMLIIYQKKKKKKSSPTLTAIVCVFDSVFGLLISFDFF